MNKEELEKAYKATPEHLSVMVIQEIAQFFITEARNMEERELTANERAKATPEHKAWVAEIKVHNKQKRREEAAKAQERQEQADRSAQLTAEWKASLKGKEKVDLPPNYVYTIEFIYVNMYTNASKRYEVYAESELDAYRKAHEKISNLFHETGQYFCISGMSLIIEDVGH